VLRVRRIDASTIGFTVGAATEVQVASNIPTATAGHMVYVRTLEAVAKSVDVDSVEQKFLLLAR
jgi:hypothetical protein